jgi:hypothetical protein
MDQHLPPERPILSLVVNVTSNEGSAKDRGADISEPWPDPYLPLLVTEVTNTIGDASLRRFLSTILNDPAAARVLMTRVMKDGKPNELRLVRFASLTMDVLRHANVSQEDADVVLATSYLHGIEYCLQANRDGHKLLRTAIYPLLRREMCRLKSANPSMASQIALCMRWGDLDEDTLLAEWLKTRARQSIEVLDLARF